MRLLTRKERVKSKILFTSASNRCKFIGDEKSASKVQDEPFFLLSFFMILACLVQYCLPQYLRSSE